MHIIIFFCKFSTTQKLLDYKLTIIENSLRFRYFFLSRYITVFSLIYERTVYCTGNLPKLKKILYNCSCSNCSVACTNLIEFSFIWQTMPFIRCTWATIHSLHLSKPKFFSVCCGRIPQKSRKNIIKYKLSCNL